MPFHKKTIFCLVVPVAIVAFTGCQQDTASTKKPGTYAAARHSSVGSNIPQRESVDSTGSTYDPNQLQNMQESQGMLGQRGLTGGSR